MEPLFASTLLDSLHRIRPSLAVRAMTRMPYREGREGKGLLPTVCVPLRVFPPQQTPSSCAHSRPRYYLTYHIHAACLSATADALFAQFMLGRDLIAAPVLTPQDPASSATQVPAVALATLQRTVAQHSTRASSFALGFGFRWLV